jgi:hypothetical protein
MQHVASTWWQVLLLTLRCCELRLLQACCRKYLQLLYLVEVRVCVRAQ